MTLLAAHNVYKTYRLNRADVPVLRGASLTLERGEWLAVHGASGSGKSTLLHLLGGLDRPDRRAPPDAGSGSGGVIEFEGRPLSRLRARALDRYRSSSVGFVFQLYHLLPELNVLENVVIGAMIRHGRIGYTRRASKLRENARSLLETFGLGHRLRHRSAELSGGERQRVAIARALVNDPPVLLADEPTGNLDPVTGGAILDELARWRRRTGLAIVMVTHDPDVAARADRVVRLHEGRIAADPPRGQPSPAGGTI